MQAQLNHLEVSLAHTLTSSRHPSIGRAGLGRLTSVEPLILYYSCWCSRSQDEIHPAALPGSYVYGNSLFFQLKLEDEARKADALKRDQRDKEP